MCGARYPPRLAHSLRGVLLQLYVIIIIYMAILTARLSYNRCSRTFFTKLTNVCGVLHIALRLCVIFVDLSAAFHAILTRYFLSFFQTFPPSIPTHAFCLFNKGNAHLYTIRTYKNTHIRDMARPSILRKNKKLENPSTHAHTTYTHVQHTRMNKWHNENNNGEKKRWGKSTTVRLHIYMHINTHTRHIIKICVYVLAVRFIFFQYFFHFRPCYIRIRLSVLRIEETWMWWWLGRRLRLGKTDCRQREREETERPRAPPV